jgi:hypothetical protein
MMGRRGESEKNQCEMQNVDLGMTIGNSVYLTNMVS